MNKKRILGAITLASVLVFGLAACGGGNKGGGNKATETEDISKMPIAVKNDKKAIDGGTLDVAVVMDTQFQGLFQQEFYQDNYDAQYMLPTVQPLFNNDADFKIVDGGPADLKLDEDANTATIKLRDNLKWSDGKDVTADDVIFSYEVIGHKDYTGIRYDDNFTNIVGMEDYHDGKSPTISGIEKVNDKEVKITYKEVHPGMQQLGGGVWGSVLPKHAFEGIAVKDMESSDAVRKNPV
ncbi:oligopeptide ABC transporter substrate-binding protein Opp2A, partial [Enterococcus faecalis]